MVTTVHGTATVSRASLSQPVPLKFKDDVFAQDRVSTGDDSVARILLGGRAIVTVRERSSLTITEVPHVSTIDVGVGRAAIAVAKERMKPGETIEIRTPNAVAGIRGTIVVVEVDQGPAALTTRFTVITGEVLVRQLQGGQPFGGGVTLGANQQAQFTGHTPPATRSLSSSEARQLSNSFKTTKSVPPAEVSALLVTQSQALATAGTSGVPTPGLSSPDSVTNENSNGKSSSAKRQDSIVSTILTPKAGRDDIQVTADDRHVAQQINSSGTESTSNGGSNSLLSNSLVGKQRGRR
ncbi:MAG: hypothetical protein AUH76_15500 [Candidatus Rokubacteria bacterium 13_1_40CM_4_67_11]|nr:MAG: hypothetical protein AUH76_15500 [Candidatus Rokubacteria bacterium 13_1_40CM_4_67_11]